MATPDLKRKITDCDFREAQAAMESLAKTIADLANVAPYEVEDALDATVERELSGSERFQLIGAVHEGVYASGGTFAKRDRFASFEEMSQWVCAAAEHRGYTHREDDHMGKRWLHVDVPGLGELNYSVTDDPKYPPPSVSRGLSCKREADAPKLERLCRDLLREASALQADA